MPPGSKKRKAAKKKQEQASSTQINLKSNNHDSRSQGEKESDGGVISQENYKKSGFTEEDAIRTKKDTDERIEIIDSSHDHDKSSSSSGSSSSSSSSSDDESREVKKIDDDKETGESVSEVVTVTSVPDQPLPIAGDAPFMGSTANAIVENTGLMESTLPSEPNSGELVEISHVDTMVSNEADEKALPKPTEVSLASDEIRQASSGANDTDVKESEEKTSPLPESNGVPEGNGESEVVISHEEETPVRPTHGIAERTSWFSCCGLFDVVSGSSK